MKISGRPFLLDVKKFSKYIQLIFLIFSLPAVSQVQPQCPTPLYVHAAGNYGVTLCNGTGTLRLDGPQGSTRYYIFKDGQLYQTGFKRWISQPAPTYYDWAITQTGTYTIKAQNEQCDDDYYPMSGEVTFIAAASSPTLNISPSSDPSKACEASGFKLTASGVGNDGTKYTWHSPSLDQEHLPSGLEFFPENSGDYYVTAYSDCGVLLNSTPVNVIIVPRVSKPTIDPSLGTRCKGSGTSVFIASASNVDSYSWSISSSGSSTISYNAQNEKGKTGTINWDPNFVGLTAIYATAYGCGGSQQTSNPAYVTVGTISPATLTGTKAICPNGETAVVTLTSNSSSGKLDDIQYRIRKNQELGAMKYGHSDDEYTTPVSSLAWTVSEPGTYTVLATGNGCTNVLMNGSAVISYKQTGTITVKGYTVSHPQPYEAGSFDVCSTEQLKLTVTGSSDYTWYADRSMPDIHNFDEHLVKNTDIEPYQNGVFWVVGKESVCGIIGVFSNNAGVTMTNPADASLTPSGLLKVPSTSLGRLVSVPVNNNVSYHWFKGQTEIQGANTNSITVSEPGTYYAKLIATNGTCVVTSPVPLQFVRNQLPVISVQDQTVTLPIRTATVNANVTDDGSIQQYIWELISDQSDALLTQANTPNLVLSELHKNVYRLRISASDDFGEMSSAEASVTVLGPPGNYNYVRESVIQVEGKTSEASLAGLSVEEKSVQTTYVDGIGRSVQSVAQQQSTSKKDLIQVTDYDSLGRESIKYLPFTSGNSGDYKNAAISGVNTFYQEAPLIAHDVPYAQTIFEASPLNRVLKQGAPGLAFQPVSGTTSSSDHSIKKSYQFNQPVDSVYQFSFDGNTGLVSASLYGINTLFANKTFDENNSVVIEFVDKLGRTVCKKVQAGVNATIPLYACTYYVYDIYGNLVVVIPPEGFQKLKSVFDQH